MFTITFIKNMLIKGKSGQRQSLPESIKSSYRIHTTPFPYIDWFYDTHLKFCSKPYQVFFENLLVNEFDNNINALYGRGFINSCKLSIYLKSDALRDEIVYSEGVVRFVSGMLLALISSLALIVFFGSTFNNLFWPYMFLILAFGIALRPLRVKEILAILDSYQILASEHNNNSRDKQLKGARVQEKFK